MICFIFVVKKNVIYIVKVKYQILDHIISVLQSNWFINT